MIRIQNLIYAFVLLPSVDAHTDIIPAEARSTAPVHPRLIATKQTYWVPLTGSNILKLLYKGSRSGYWSLFPPPLVKEGFNSSHPFFSSLYINLRFFFSYYISLSALDTSLNHYIPAHRQFSQHLKRQKHANFPCNTPCQRYSRHPCPVSLFPKWPPRSLLLLPRHTLTALMPKLVEAGKGITGWRRT